MKNKAFVDCESVKLFVDTLIPYMSFGEWLRKQLNDSGINNAELARSTGLSPTYIGNLVRDFSPNTKSGKVRPSEEVVAKIAQSLNADLDEARDAAGYSSAAPDEIHNVLKGVTLIFEDKSNLNDEQKQKIMDLVKVIAAGVIAEKNNL